MIDSLLSTQWQLNQRGQRYVLAKVVKTEGSVPREVGAAMLVLPDAKIVGTIGGGAVETEVIRASLTLLKNGSPQLFEYTLGPEYGMRCGGRMMFYLEPSSLPESVYIFGGGHVAKPLAHLTSLLGFRTLVIDDRPDFANAARFPDADQILTMPFLEAAGQLPLPPKGGPCYVIIVTRDAEIDYAVLTFYLERELTYLGMIGSQTKLGSFRARLRKEHKEALLSRVHCPVGLAIHAETPEEIALSIAAEMVATRRNTQ